MNEIQAMSNFGWAGFAAAFLIAVFALNLCGLISFRKGGKNKS